MRRTINNKIALSTSCLGLHESHDLGLKLKAAADHGFKGIEIVFGDLEVYAATNKISMIEAAKSIQRLCEELQLCMLALVPFENYEGSKTPLEERLEKAELWIELARLLGVEYIQVPAQFGKDVIRDEDVLVAELQQLSDLASSSPSQTIKIAYEPMSWSTCYSTWQDALRLVQKVDRKNFGLCMDTFHIVSKVYACNTSPDGLYPEAHGNLKVDLETFLHVFPLEKLFYIQLSDGEKFEEPWSKTHPWYEDGVDREFCWSKFGRPFPLEREFGGYFPVMEMVKAWVVEKAYRGWISLEAFDRRMRNPAFQIENGASRARRSLQRLQGELGASMGKL